MFGAATTQTAMLKYFLAISFLLPVLAFGQTRGNFQYDYSTQLFSPSNALNANLLSGSLSNIIYKPTYRFIATNSTANTNLILDTTISRQTLFLSNNISLTNFSGFVSNGGGDFVWTLKPQSTIRTIVYPALGVAGNAIYWATNDNAPMWTSVTNGKTYKLAVSWDYTNIVASITEWK